MIRAHRSSHYFLAGCGHTSMRQKRPKNESTKISIIFKCFLIVLERPSTEGLNIAANIGGGLCSATISSEDFGLARIYGNFWQTPAGTVRLPRQQGPALDHALRKS